MIVSPEIGRCPRLCFYTKAKKTTFLAGIFMFATLSRTALPDVPWDKWAKRIFLHVPLHLSPEGVATSGGRQRNVRDMAKLIYEKWGRECIILQKASKNWERLDSCGIPVIGIKSILSAYGDPGFGHATSRFVGKDDAIIYVGHEDAWPFFVKNAKGFHVGVWWDGPFQSYKKWLAGIRTEALFDACRSVLCVDTNIINWLRARSRTNQDSANRAIYIPNCVDLAMLPDPIRREAPNKPFRLLFARRYEIKRGPQLALDAVALLNKRGFPVELIMSTAEGQTGSEAIVKGAHERGIVSLVRVCENDMDSIFSLYAAADAAIVPTLWSEGTSYSCIEAIAAGLPVVTTTVGGLPNLVIPGFNGYVVPPHAEPIAKAIAELAEPNKWRQCRSNCLSMRAALSKLEWNRRILEWLKS
ncbi:MAG: glycosyltransferase family 4 protein [Kiritimatiellia bacterium]|jgi:glycosyltransferase involved in cell wall biosynthesis